MDVLFLKILNMSISASFLILAVILMRAILKKAPKWINCVLWALVAVRLLYPISFESSMSLIPNSQPVPLEIFMVEPPKTHTSTIIDPTVNPNLPDVPSAVLDTTIDRMQTKSVYATLIWMSGVAAMLAYATISYIRIRHKVKASLHLQDKIWICDDIPTPFILGFFNPKIYLPSGTGEEQFPYIIAHEFAHLKRLDHWWKPFGYLVLTIHWFNPLVWIAYILLCKDIELACDEKVIRKLNQSESISYSETLLSCSINRKTMMVCPLAFGEVSVKERVKRVLNYKKPALWIIVVSMLCCIVVAMCFLTNPKENKNESNGYSTFFNAKVLEVNGDDLLVECIESFDTGISDGSKVSLSQDTLAPQNSPDCKVGDEIRIMFNGNVMETDPLQLDTVFAIYQLNELGSNITEWINYNPHLDDKENSKEISLPEYPGTTFHWNPGSVQVSTDSETIELYTGMPIWNVFFYDLTNDGKPELCSTISIGSGIIDTRILIYDYAKGSSYELEDRGKFDYSLRMENDKLYVDKKIYNSDELVDSGYLSFKNGFIEIIKSDSTSLARLDAAINKELQEHYASDKPDGLIHVESYALLANESKSGTPLIGNDNHMEEVTVYLLVFHEKYSTYGSTLESVGGSYIPTAITFSINESDEYTLKEYWEPRDGSDYTTDIRAKFPGTSAEDAFNDQAYIEDLKTQNYNKALASLNSTGSLDLRIAELLDIIQSSPATSSNPSDYITANKEEYDTLVNYGKYTLQYCFSEFLKGGQTDLYGSIMAYVCRDIMIIMGDEYISDDEKIYTAQDWFDKFKEDTKIMKEQISQEDMEKYYPASWLLLQIINQ